MKALKIDTDGTMQPVGITGDTIDSRMTASMSISADTSITSGCLMMRSCWSMTRDC